MDAQEEKKDETVSVDALEMAEFETLSLDLNFSLRATDLCHCPLSERES